MAEPWVSAGVGDDRGAVPARGGLRAPGRDARGAGARRWPDLRPDRGPGGDGDDVLTGGSADDLLAGQAGNDTLLGKGGFDLKGFLAQVKDLAKKPCYVEQEGAVDEMVSAKENLAYLKGLSW